ncbi:MAG: tetratricopeptide repeat protein [Lachnospiraceae bacterium]|nr:tetratricopeptide repeat protein [Lachnospiraceae bacterium]
MNYIKIFLASSIVEFEHERTSLKEYISTLNDIYIRRGVYFEFQLCENLSNAVALGRKQDEYNAFIREAQYFYILIGKKAGDYTIEEFDVALKAFRESGSPKIYTYFLTLPEGQSAEESTLQFMQRMDRELGHYYTTFSHIDAVKLNLLLEICRDPLAGGQVKLEDGKAILDGKSVLSIENVPVYSKNETIQKLLKEKRELEEEYSALMGMPESDAVIRMRLSNSSKRNEITEQLHTLEMDVLGLCRTMSEKRQLGQSINWRERKALEYIDAGNYEAAVEILKDPVWKEEVRQAEERKRLAKELNEQADADIREYISGQRTRIQTIRSTGINAEKAREITGIYEEISVLAEDNQLDMDVLYDYTSFLDDQNQFTKGIQVVEKLYKWYEQKAGVTEQEKARLFNLMGNLYSDNRNFSSAETAYRKTLEIYSRLAQEDPAAYEPNVVMTCNNLAILLKNTGRFKESEESYRKALEIYSHLAQEEPAAYDPAVATICNNLANLLSDTGRFKEAEEFYRKALEIRTRLAQENPAAYESDVAMTCNNLALLLSDTGRFKEAEEFCRKALEIHTRLAQEDPAAYEPNVAMTCNNLAILLKNTGHFKEAEEFYRKALEIYSRLAQEDPAAYEPDVATTCSNLALLLVDTGFLQEAKELLQKVYQIYIKYPHYADKAEKVRRYLESLS